MALVVMGCDLSSKSLAVVTTWDDVHPRLAFRPLPSDVEMPQKCSITHQWASRLVRKQVDAGHDVHVFVENPIYVRGFQTLIALGRVNGAFLAGAYHGGASSVMGVDISRWKQIAVGNGNANKKQVAQWCKEAWPAVAEAAGTNDNLTDAAGINRYGAEWINPRFNKARKRR